jgi:hypothetical protein
MDTNTSFPVGSWQHFYRSVGIQILRDSEFAKELWKWRKIKLKLKFRYVLDYRILRLAGYTVPIQVTSFCTKYW